LQRAEGYQEIRTVPVVALVYEAFCIFSRFDLGQAYPVMAAFRVYPPLVGSTATSAQGCNPATRTCPPLAEAVENLAHYVARLRYARLGSQPCPRLTHSGGSQIITVANVPRKDMCDV